MCSDLSPHKKTERRATLAASHKRSTGVGLLMAPNLALPMHIITEFHFRFAGSMANHSDASQAA
jgi:hypothetical protein